jgi:acetyl esterase/lipase
VATPTITVYTPQRNRAAASKTPAVIVFPGGGYKILAIDLEGTEVCDWLTAKGVACVVLKYRVPDSGPHWDKKCRCHVTPPAPLALQDAQRAISMVRAGAAKWNIDPHKIGVLGFSAGGHLSAAVSTHFRRRSYAPVDAADRESCRPDFAVALYPGHLWTDESKFELDPDIRVTKATPPTLLLHAQNDPVDDVNHTLVYYLALRKAGVPTALHIYPHGGHAFGLRPTRELITHWPELVEKWIATLW